MKSFRLDRESIADFLDTWPALVLVAVVWLILVALGIHREWGRLGALILGVAYGVFALRGLVAGRLQEKYPGARWGWLLMVGFTSLGLGVAGRMAFPKLQGTTIDRAWLGLAFGSILAFVVANFRNPHVMR